MYRKLTRFPFDVLGVELILYVRVKLSTETSYNENIGFVKQCRLRYHEKISKNWPIVMDWVWKWPPTFRAIFFTCENKQSKELVGKKIDSLISLNDPVIEIDFTTDNVSDLSSTSSPSSSKKTKVKSSQMTTSFCKLHNPDSKCRNLISAGKLSLVSVNRSAKKI